MPYIDNNFIDDLVESSDIISVVSARVPLKKSGANYTACCPFHHEKTPSFSVSQSKQLFKCFGCGVAGGVLQFIQQYDHLDFPQSVEALAREMSIDVVYEKTNYSPEQSEKISQELQEKKAQKDLIAQVSQHYEQQLRTHPIKDKVIEYIKTRKISGLIAKRFNMGFAPPDARSLLEDFPADSYEKLIVLGVLVADQHKAGQYYARFRDRLTFPIHNNKGEVIAFGARGLSADAKPKYLNSPETPIFSKSQELYGLYHCRKYSRDMNHILVVEGYMDVVSLHQSDITNVVATLGTATSEAHLQLLFRSTKNIVFCFDGDNAGKKAAWRALEIGLSWLKKGYQLKFLFLPDGQDPDTLVQKEGKPKFLTRIESALSLSIYLFNHLKEQVDFKSGEGKTQFTELAIEQIAKVQYDLYQEQLVITLAELSLFSETKIKEKLNTLIQANQARQNAINTIPNFDSFSEAMPYPGGDEQNMDFDIGQNGQDKANPNALNTQTTSANDLLQPALLDSLILVYHYPNIANSVNQKTLKKITQFNHGQLLVDLINTADYDGKIDKKRFLDSCAKQPYIQQLQTALEKQPNISNEAGANIGLNEHLQTLERNYIKTQITQLKDSKLKDADYDLKQSQLLNQLTQLKGQYSQD